MRIIQWLISNGFLKYYESQHTELTPFFDNKKTVSSVSRGEQRRIYDQRRKDVLPKHGIRLIIIPYTDFGNTKKLERNHDYDFNVVKDILKRNGLELKNLSKHLSTRYCITISKLKNIILNRGNI